MSNELSYYFTIHGEVYAGEEIEDPAFPDHVILIQRDKLKDYQQQKDISLEQINKFGWALPRRIIKKHLKIDIDKFLSIKPKMLNEGWDLSYDRRVMFIVGAGASAHCVSGGQKMEFTSDGLRPPCGPELFHNRFETYYGKYPGVIQSLNELQGTGAIDVESFFEKEWHEIFKYGNEQVIARHINIQYYLQELLKNVSLSTWNRYSSQNLYATLASRLQKLYARNRKLKFAFVSFNQDTILEYYLKRYFDFSLAQFEDYITINDGPVSIFKPHGSWNWGWKFPSQESRSISMADWLFQNKITLHEIYYEFLGTFEEMLDWGSYGANYLHDENRVSKFNVNKNRLSIIAPGNENMYFPALLLPYRDKDEFTMPSSHYWDLFNYLPYVETLIIMGWKGNERLFNQLLKKNARNIKKLIIADPLADAVANQLVFLKDNGAEIIRYEGFEDFISRGLDTEFPLTYD